MNIRSEVILAPYTTFQIGGPARLFCPVSSKVELVEAVNFAKSNSLPIFVLGKGSNLLVSDAGFPGLVIKNEIMGIEFHKKSDSENAGGEFFVTAGAGETWDDLVDETVRRGLHGIENLSAIPGTVGAAPVQNIGAYGSEIADTLVSVQALDTKSMEFVDLSGAECRFAYRDSIFKHEKGRYVITQVTLRLMRDGAVDISYRDLKEYFTGESRQCRVTGKEASDGKIAPSIKDVRDAVISIRLSKLPDWTHWGTAGSFFKNPVIPASQYAELVQRYPGFPSADGMVKVSLGWILDKICNVKEMASDLKKVHSYERQALVLVTTPGATAAEVIKLAHELIDMVKVKTGIEIEGEVEWVC